MKITLRLAVSVLITAAFAAALVTYVQVRDERGMLVAELNARAEVIGESLQESVTGYVQSGSRTDLSRIAARFSGRVRLIGIAIYDSQGVLLSSSPSLGFAPPHPGARLRDAIERNRTETFIDSVGSRPAHVCITPLHAGSRTIGTLVLYHDVAYIALRLREIWVEGFLRMAAQIFLLIIVIIIVVRWSVTGPIAQIAQWMRTLRTGKSLHHHFFPGGDLFGPLAAEVSLFARSLTQARAAAQEEARLRVESESLWTAERLKEHVKIVLNGKNLFVVSNREPYMHTGTGTAVQWSVPAGGLVTALDPILRACGGLWIAQGSGSGDRETVDAQDHIPVPPDEPSYTLRRVFLTQEEEEGYYNGFSNEGIWPLCHITHTRPLFEMDDWVYYRNVNRKFADALLEEIRDEEAPLILIQDYHLALVPLMVKTERPDARVAIFWHIPWPNPEVFGICPWKQDLLLGLLGADLVGFHIQFHCNNFLETVDRFLESKINWDQFSVERLGQPTSVRPFPISVAHPFETGRGDRAEDEAATKEGLLKRSGCVAEYMVVGVDRIDYTKGIAERFRAVKRFLEKYPEYVGRCTFVELGAPSRTHIKRYHDLNDELDEIVESVNAAWQTGSWKPIVFLKAQHGHQTIGEYYRCADVCMVTSLHDGMNLVAKEFIATRTDEDGVLILSQFTGASRELPDALIVNPYDIEEMADALYTALRMDPDERRRRMREMRQVVKERNVYRWAANIITTLSRLRMTV